MNRVKPLTLKELELKEEMKSRCLTKGQYIDEKAKDKFYMLCHLEEYEVQYYDLLNVIEELRSWLEEQYKNLHYAIYSTNALFLNNEDLLIKMDTINKILSKLNELEGGKNE